MVQKYKKIIKKHHAEANFSLFPLFTFHFFLYLCSRFPRNRWQEVSRGLLCCAWNDTTILNV